MPNEARKLVYKVVAEEVARIAYGRGQWSAGEQEWYVFDGEMEGGEVRSDATAAWQAAADRLGMTLERVKELRPDSPYLFSGRHKVMYAQPQGPYQRWVCENGCENARAIPPFVASEKDECLKCGGAVTDYEASKEYVS